MLAMFSMLLACNSKTRQAENTIRVKGSDTMLILNRLWAEGYMQKFPGTTVYVEGGGTGSGVAAMIEGSVDISAASRPLQAEEIQKLAARYQSIGIAHLVGKDALSVYVHPDNPVRDLTLKQLKEIFSGQIVNWIDVGGDDERIQVISRPPNSGTHQYFKSHILQGENYRDDADIEATTAGIVRQVMRYPNAISYGGFAYGDSLWHCRINSIPPTEASVRFDLYPISRYLYFYTIDKPKGTVKHFLNWVFSEEGQAIVREAGYITLW